MGFATMKTAGRGDITQLFELGRSEGDGKASAAPQGRNGSQSAVGRRFGDLILADGLVTQEQFEQALAEQKKTNEKLGEILVRLGLITEEQLVHFLSRQYRGPEVAVPKNTAPAIITQIPAL